MYKRRTIIFVCILVGILRVEYKLVATSEILVYVKTDKYKEDN